MMDKPFRSSTALIQGAVAFAWLLAGPAHSAFADDKPADVFGLTRVHEFHLEFTAKEWERLQAVVGGMRGPGMPPGGGPAAPKPAEKPSEDPIERHKNAGFGLEFPWAHATLVENGKKYADVGIR